MKTFYAILCITIASLTQLQAQAPQGFNYQATVRNSSGDLIVNTNVYFKFNVIQGSQTAVPIFTETHYVPTDDLGQVNLIIGQGTATTGAFSELDWSLGSYYLGIELSINGANNYVAMGTTQLLSVPYALYAENSGNSTPTTPNIEAVLAENNSANNQQIKDLLDPTEAQDAVTKSYVDALMTRIKDLENKINPSVQTTEVFVMSETEVNCGGNAVNIGISDLLSKGVVWSESPNPTISLSSKTNEGNNASDFSSIITGLQKNRVYYVRAYLETSNGVVYGNERTFITHMDSGQEYQGGYVFYIFQPNDQGYVEGEVHGLIAAKEIIDPGFTWTSGDVTGFKSIGITRAEDRLNNGDINSGISNCEKALTHLIENSLDGLFPAISQATSFKAEGFTDWHLPSYGQLIKLRQNLVETSFITVPDGYFWSSSLMDNALGAMSYNLNSGGACGCAYFETYYILPIRTF